MEAADEMSAVFFLWPFAYSFVPLPSSKVLSLDNTKQKKMYLFCIVLAYSYLCLHETSTSKEESGSALPD